MKRMKLNSHPWLGICLTVLAFGAAADVLPPRIAVVTLDIRSQPIGDALNEFGRQSGIQILLYSEVANGLTGPALVGVFTPDEALMQLLSNTGLTYSMVNERTVAIHREVSIASGGKATRKEAAPRVMRLANLQISEEPNFQVAQATGRQAADRQDSNDELRKPRIEEVIVTAQKREERLIDTPQSVTVLTSELLTNLGATQFRDFASTVPGLSFSTAGAGFNEIVLRGVTSGNDISSTIGIYVDEVPYGSSTAFTQSNRYTLDVGLFDLDRIEVLRGPQGTLYGASTMGGLLKYVTKRPDATGFGVDMQAGTSGTRDGDVSYNAAAAVNAPIVTDKLALRATGFYSRDGGYIDNLALDDENVNRSDTYGGRADLLFTPSKALSVRITAFLQDIARDGWATADYTFAGTPGGLDQRRLLAEPFDQRFRLVSGTVTYDLGPAMLTSISSYQTVRTEQVWDFKHLVPIFASIGLPFSAIGLPTEMTTDKFTQEVRLASYQTKPLEWLIGGFYTQENSENHQRFVEFDLAGEPSTIDLATASSPSRYEEYAAFGNLTWHFTDKFDVSGGIRYAENRQKFEQIASGLLLSSFPTRRSDEHVVTYLANARYRFSDHATGYLRYATGYRPGGPNFVANDPITGLPIAPETFEADRLKSYEAGIKTETEDGRFGIDVAGYHIDWSNIQISVLRGGFSVFGNAPGGASIRGAELTLTARPTSGFTVSGAFAYQDAKLSEADPDLGAAKGERLPKVPRFTAAVSADYELSIGSVQPTIGATLRYVGDRTAGFDNSPAIPQYYLPDYTAVDLRTGFVLHRVNVQFYARNIFDERGQLSAFTTVGPPRVAILQPLSLGVTVSTTF